jgi:hypothetical protein
MLQKLSIAALLILGVQLTLDFLAERVSQMELATAPLRIIVFFFAVAVFAATSQEFGGCEMGTLFSRKAL